MSDTPAESADSPKSGMGLDAFQQPPTDRGLSLDDLSQAFAEMLGSGHDPYATPDSPAEEAELAAGPDAPAAEDAPAEDSCEVSPRTILEAMLFVGNRENQPLNSQQVAGLMRGVRPAEVDDLVRELNQQYAADGRPYQIFSEGAGYRLGLRPEFSRVRDKFQGRIRHARLSPAAVEVLAIVAYDGPLTAHEVARRRGAPSGAILSLLVRRQLLRLDRPEPAPSPPVYLTTRRFLEVFGLQGLEDLPRSQDVDTT